MLALVGRHCKEELVEIRRVEVAILGWLHSLLPKRQQLLPRRRWQRRRALYPTFPPLRRPTPSSYLFSTATITDLIHHLHYIIALLVIKGVSVSHFGPNYKAEVSVGECDLFWKMLADYRILWWWQWQLNIFCYYVPTLIFPSIYLGMTRGSSLFPPIF